MAFLGTKIDLNDIPQSEQDFAPLPPGTYSATVAGAELKDTRSGGKMIAVRYDVTGPTHEGRVVFDNINIQNANPKAEEIGRQQLGSLMRAIGLSAVEDTDQLIGGQVSIKLDIEKSEEWGDKNRVKRISSLTGGAVPTQPAKTAAPAAGKPAWAK